ncbi:sialate O-acetylesterase-like isoform X2 [Dreissena polymorpha]|uniref:sialate O-acetylesterase-like isoform X2 n=1 Tax=Dreissena polymorpha TaxID=45954 RepID=UPI002264DBED|nr:sialate O-acetylesterase-like isoform X2 [Dreissena polymorpha]
MEYFVSWMRNFSTIITTAMQSNNQRILHLSHNPLNASAREPTISSTWQAPGHDWQTEKFSAVCLIFAMELSKHLHQPFGMVETSVGGTPIHAWSSPAALHACPQQKKKRALNEKRPSVLYNGMIAPILPMTIFGAIWYQGEADWATPHLYACQFEAMISDWRAKFHQASKNQTSVMFPFGFVQLAPHRNVTGAHFGWPDIRWAQTGGYGYVPNPALKTVFMAVAMDLPDYASPYGK